MGLFYKVSNKKILEVRNKIIIEKGISTLKKNGFERSPFSVAWYGKTNLGDYNYDLCRLNEKSHIETISIHILSGDRWVQIFLNIFQLSPSAKSLQQLKDIDGIQFYLPPNTNSRMRLRIDDFEGMPIFRKLEYRLKSFHTESGFQKRVIELGDLIENDLNNIDLFVKRWHQLNSPLITDWEGKAT